MCMSSSPGGLDKIPCKKKQLKGGSIWTVTQLFKVGTAPKHKAARIFICSYSVPFLLSIHPEPQSHGMGAHI